MQTIITALIAFVTGFVGGNALPSAETASKETTSTTPTEMIVAGDFVTTRPLVDSLPKETLSQDEVDGLILMREEEKFARDVYQTLYQTWQQPIFANIAQSEQTHTEAVRDLLEKYDISDPVVDDTIGVFVNTDLQSLYNSLTKEGSVSLIEALRVGATIEDLDINDLEGLMAATDNEDIKIVYENLSRGSRNHLRSFVGRLKSLESDYEPQYISENEYETIINSNQETGMDGNANGRGWGRMR